MPGARTRGENARQLFVMFLEGMTTKCLLKHARLHTIVDTKLILSNSFTHDRVQISSVKREKDWGASPTDPRDEPGRMVQKC